MLVTLATLLSGALATLSSGALAALSSGALAALASCRRSASPPPARPNVLLVTIDTIRADHVGAYGAKGGATPAIDAFARDGILFEQAIAPAPLTLPSHASILSGILPFRTGVRVNGTDRVSAAVPLVAEAFAGAGYRTGAVVSALVLRGPTGIGRGFAHFDDRFAANADRDRRTALPERPCAETVERARAWLAEGSRADSRAPFLLWVHLYDPHAPYEPPAPFAERFRGREYDGEIASADSCFSRLLESVDPAATLVVLAGDHGESLGEHGEKGHGVFIYDATIRVPLIVRLPGRRLAGLRVATQVRLTDVAPTLRRAAGLPAIATDGTDLSPLYSAPRSPDRPAFSEADYPAFVLGWSPMRALRRDGRKFIDAPRRELYDLRTDAGETRNLWGREGDSGRDLARELQRVAAGKPLAPADSSAADPEIARRLASLGYISGGAKAVDYDRIDPARVDPKDHIAAWTLIESALLARIAGDHEKAVGIFEKILESYPTVNPVVLRDYAEACRRTGRLDRSIALYEKVLATTEPDANDFFGLGVAWHEKGDDAKAAANLERAVALDPSDKTAWLNLGSLRLAARQLEPARDAFVKASALDPRSVDALSGLASIAFQRREYGQAEGLLQAALRVSPGNAEMQFHLALVKRAMGNPEAARQIYAALARSAEPAVARRAEEALRALR